MLSLAITPKHQLTLALSSLLLYCLGLWLFAALELESGVLWGLAPVVVVGSLWGTIPGLGVACGTWCLAILWSYIDGSQLSMAFQHQASGLVLPLVGILCGYLHRLEGVAVQARRERDLLMAALEGFDEPLEVLTQEGTVLYVNAAWERQSGYTSAEVIGHMQSSQLHPGPRDAQLQEAMREARSLRWRGELTLLRKDRQLRSFSAVATWMRYLPDQVHALVRLRDLRDEREREQKLRMFHALPDVVLQVNAEAELLYFQGPPSLKQKITTNVSMLVAIPPEVMPVDVLHQAIQMVKHSLHTGESSSFEFPLGFDEQREDYVARLIPNQDASEVLIFVRQISDRKQLERDLERTQLSFRNIIERNQDGIVIVDHEGIVRFINPAAQRFFYHGGARLGEFFDYPLIVGASTEMEIVLEVHDDGFEVSGIGEMRLTETSWVDGSAYLASIRDITERKRAETRLQHQAFHDLLTGLPNRALFLQRLEESIDLRQQSPGYQFAVLFMDLDRFKNVNDSLGHDAGDQLLVDIAQRLGQSVRKSDTVSRLGGDEFVILISGIQSTDNARLVAEQILASFASPFMIKGHSIYTSGSIGIALGETEYAHPQDVLRDADTAMYRAKELGKSRYVVFDREMHLRAQRLLRLESELQRAVEHNEFLIHLQPIVGLQSKQLTGFEVLVRWMHPHNGLIFPGDFIEVAEDTGLIVPIGWWVMREACLVFRQWQQHWPQFSPSLSVNLSARQVAQHDLVERVLSILAETGFPAERLKLEITESALIDQVDDATIMLARLRQHGIQIHMDDFGTGYSSLSYLHRFPIDGLKIDRSFVNGMETNNENAEIVRAIVSMAHSLDLGVTAEGAENVEQVGILRALGCERVQGYVMSRPVDVETAAKIAQQPAMYSSLVDAGVASQSDKAKGTSHKAEKFII